MIVAMYKYYPKITHSLLYIFDIQASMVLRNRMTFIQVYDHTKKLYFIV